MTKQLGKHTKHENTNDHVNEPVGGAVALYLNV